MTFSRKLLGQVYFKCEGRCFYCGKEVDPFEGWEPDHITPRSQGGSDQLENLTLACLRCNRNKGGRNLAQYRETIRARILKHIHAALEATQYIGQDGAGYIHYKTEEALTLAQKLVSEARIVFHGEEDQWLTEEEEREAERLIKEIEDKAIQDDEGAVN